MSRIEKFGVDAGDHDVLLKAPRRRLISARTRRLLIFAATVRAHVNRVLDGVAVSRPGAKVAEVAKP